MVLDRYKERAAKQEIGRVLWEVWDPIGVRELGGPSDEYNDYVNGVYEALLSGASDQILADHLLRITREQMELGGATLEAMRPTVAALRTTALPK